MFEKLKQTDLETNKGRLCMFQCLYKKLIYKLAFTCDRVATLINCFQNYNNRKLAMVNGKCLYVFNEL